MKKRDLTLIFVSGPICSGKTTIAEQLCAANFGKDTYPVHYEVSSFVKKHLKTFDREQLQNSRGVGEVVAHQIVENIQQAIMPPDRSILHPATRTIAVVSGARELEVIKIIEAAFPSAEKQYLWVSAPYEVLYKRWSTRARVGDGVPHSKEFSQLLSADNLLGLNDIAQYFATRQNTNLLSREGV